MRSTDAPVGFCGKLFARLQAEPESPKTDAKDTDKKKKKIRLELHRDQVFLDSNEAYVWIYEPTSITNILLGTGIGMYCDASLRSVARIVFVSLVDFFHVADRSFWCSLGRTTGKSES